MFIALILFMLAAAAYISDARAETDPAILTIFDVLVACATLLRIFRPVVQLIFSYTLWSEVGVYIAVNLAVGFAFTLIGSMRMLLALCWALNKPYLMLTRRRRVAIAKSNYRSLPQDRHAG